MMLILEATSIQWRKIHIERDKVKSRTLKNRYITGFFIYPCLFTKLYFCVIIINMYVTAYNPFSGESRPKSRLITFQLEEGKTVNALVGVDQPGDFIVPQEAWYSDMPRKPHFDTEFVAVYTNLEKVGSTKKTKTKIGIRTWIILILIELTVLYFQIKLVGL